MREAFVRVSRGCEELLEPMKEESLGIAPLGDQRITADVTIRRMQENDIGGIISTFARWHKKREQYQQYFAEQQEGGRLVLVALSKETIVGYGTIVWNSGYEPFRRGGIPEIVDLNVITDYQRQGIGTALIRSAERIVAQRSKTMIGISVEQSPAYAAANRLYPKLGYVPDGRGITPNDNELHLVMVLSE